jgi:hypothetical protein
MSNTIIEGFDAATAVGDDTSYTAMNEYLVQKYPSSTTISNVRGGPGWGYGRSCQLVNASNAFVINVPQAETYYIGFAQKYTDLTYDGIFLAFSLTTQNHVWLSRYDNSLELYTPPGLRIRVPNLIKMNRWYYIELMATISEGAGVAELRVNGQTLYYQTGLDTRGGAGTIAMNRITLNNSGYSHFDDLVINTSQFYGPRKVESLLPSEAGSGAAWTPSAGSNYQCVKEVPKNSTDYVSAAAAATDLHGCDNITNINGSIVGVQLNVDAKTETTAQNIRTKLKSSSTTDDGATQSVADATNYDTFIENQDTNPAGGAWDVTSVNAMEIGYEWVA